MQTQDVQFIHHGGGDHPVAVVLSYEKYQQFLSLIGNTQEDDDPGIPHEVVEMVVLKKMPLTRAWRKYLKLTQAEAAKRVGMSQAAFAQIEKAQKNHAETIRKVAAAFGISPAQLDWGE